MKKIVLGTLAGFLVFTVVVVGFFSLSLSSAVCQPTSDLKIAATVDGVYAKDLKPKQLEIAEKIIGIGKARGRSARDIKIALMTAAQESGIRNLSYGHLDSVGIYQQRRHYGTVSQRLNPTFSINAFFKELEKVKDRASKTLLQVALATQRPDPAAYSSPDNSFNSWESLADQLLKGVVGGVSATVSSSEYNECLTEDGESNDAPGQTFTEGCPSNSPGSYRMMGNGTRIKVCKVNGIIVNAKIASKWQYLIRKAKSEGVTLTGGGFRTAAQQIALRRAHCGSSQYAIYKMSSYSCSPPTARPGTSNHEKALAVDLNNARSFNSRVYLWMKANAPKLGITAEVRGEPWHWSLGGH